MWITINEPAVTAILGHMTGEMAPGHRDAREGLLVAHHLLLAHGMAVRAFKDSSGRKQATGVDASQPIDGIGIALSINYQEPATDDERDVAATERMDGFWNRLYLDPLFRGHYPEDVLAWLDQAGVLPDALARPRPEEMQAIGQEADFLGINYYTRNQAAWDPADHLLNASAVASRLPVTAMGWEVYPEGLFKVLKRVSMDNLEWAQGYSKRFGLVHVDFQTQQRALKRSALWYRDFIKSQP